MEQDAHADIFSQKTAHRGIHMWKCSEFRVANQLIWTDMSGRPLRSRGTQAKRVECTFIDFNRNATGINWGRSDAREAYIGMYLGELE